VVKRATTPPGRRDVTRSPAGTPLTSIDQVMADQDDLVEVTRVLRQVFNDKGT
jgi:hypothetical protein